MMKNKKLSDDLRLICIPKQSHHRNMADTADNLVKIGLTRGLVDSGDIFAQFNLHSRATFHHIFHYICSVCPGEQLLAIYWYSRADKEFILIHDDRTLDICLGQSGLHEILYIITEVKPPLHVRSGDVTHHRATQGFNSFKHEPELEEIPASGPRSNIMKTSSPSTCPNTSPDTALLSDQDNPEANNHTSDEGSEELQSARKEESKKRSKKRKNQRVRSLDWSYEVENGHKIPEVPVDIFAARGTV